MTRTICPIITRRNFLVNNDIELIDERNQIWPMDFFEVSNQIKKFFQEKYKIKNFTIDPNKFYDEFNFSYIEKLIAHIQIPKYIQCSYRISVQHSNSKKTMPLEIIELITYFLGYNEKILVSPQKKTIVFNPNNIEMEWTNNEKVEFGFSQYISSCDVKYNNHNKPCLILKNAQYQPLFIRYEIDELEIRDDILDNGLSPLSENIIPIFEEEIFSNNVVNEDYKFIVLDIVNFNDSLTLDLDFKKINLFKLDLFGRSNNINDFSNGFPKSVSNTYIISPQTCILLKTITTKSENRYSQTYYNMEEKTNCNFEHNRSIEENMDGSINYLHGFEPTESENNKSYSSYPNDNINNDSNFKKIEQNETLLKVNSNILTTKSTVNLILNNNINTHYSDCLTEENLKNNYISNYPDENEGQIDSKLFEKLIFKDSIKNHEMIKNLKGNLKLIKNRHDHILPDLAQNYLNEIKNFFVKGQKLMIDNNIKSTDYFNIIEIKIENYIVDQIYREKIIIFIPHNFDISITTNRSKYRHSYSYTYNEPGLNPFHSLINLKHNNELLCSNIYISGLPKIIVCFIDPSYFNKISPFKLLYLSKKDLYSNSLELEANIKDIEYINPVTSQMSCLINNFFHHNYEVNNLIIDHNINYISESRMYISDLYQYINEINQKLKFLKNMDSIYKINHKEFKFKRYIPNEIIQLIIDFCYYKIFLVSPSRNCIIFNPKGYDIRWIISNNSTKCIKVKNINLGDTRILIEKIQQEYNEDTQIKIFAIEVSHICNKKNPCQEENKIRLVSLAERVKIQSNSI